MTEIRIAIVGLGSRGVFAWIPLIEKILAAESIAQGTKLMRVPDFRPSKARPIGQMPKSLNLS